MNQAPELTGQVLPAVIEWLTDNGSSCIAHEACRFAPEIGLELLTTPVESPQSNGMAEAFVRTMKRNYARVNPMPSAHIVLRQLPAWSDHYNQLHPTRRWPTVPHWSSSRTGATTLGETSNPMPDAASRYTKRSLYLVAALILKSVYMS